MNLNFWLWKLFVLFIGYLYHNWRSSLDFLIWAAMKRKWIKWTGVTNLGHMDQASTHVRLQNNFLQAYLNYKPKYHVSGLQRMSTCLGKVIFGVNIMLISAFRGRLTNTKAYCAVNCQTIAQIPHCKCKWTEEFSCAPIYNVDSGGKCVWAVGFTDGRVGSRLRSFCPSVGTARSSGLWNSFAEFSPQLPPLPIGSLVLPQSNQTHRFSYFYQSRIWRLMKPSNTTLNRIVMGNFLGITASSSTRFTRWTWRLPRRKHRFFNRHVKSTLAKQTL